MPSLLSPCVGCSAGTRPWLGMTVTTAFNPTATTYGRFSDLRSEAYEGGVGDLRTVPLFLCWHQGLADTTAQILMRSRYLGEPPLRLGEAGCVPFTPNARGNESNKSICRKEGITRQLQVHNGLRSSADPNYSFLPHRQPNGHTVQGVLLPSQIYLPSINS